MKIPFILICFFLCGYANSASLFVWDETPDRGGTSGNSSAKCWLFNSDVDTATQVTYTGTNTPGAQAHCYIGYTFSFEEGRKVFTQTGTAITVTQAGSYNYLWLGDNVRYTMATWPSSGQTVYLGAHSVVTGTSNGYSNGATYNYDFGKFSGDALISMGAFWMQPNAKVNFLGDVVMTSDTFSYTLFSATNLAQNAGSWNASGISVTDAYGTSLSYAGYFTDASSIGLGEYGLVLDGGNIVLMANAVAIPEPSAASLGLLSMSAFLFRRRRKA